MSLADEFLADAGIKANPPDVPADDSTQETPSVTIVGHRTPQSLAEQFAAEAAAPPDTSHASSGTSATPSILDRTRAGLTGILDGVVPKLVGLPVDTAANVLDLAKAGIGYLGSKATQAMTGQPSTPPAWTEPFDRSQVPGSGEWIEAKAREMGKTAGVDSPFDNPNPQDRASRLLHTTGQFVGGAMNPDKSSAVGLGSMAGNAARSAIAGTAAAVTGEVAPEYAGVAGMLPALAGKAGVGTAKYLVRGGEDGRQQMAQRVQDFRNAGIDNPSLALAGGSPTMMGIESLLSKLPGSVGAYQNANAANFQGMNAKAGALRQLASEQYGPYAAGKAIQTDLEAFPGNISSGYENLLNKVTSIVGPDARIPVDNAKATATFLSTPSAGMPATTAALTQPKIANIARSLNSDTAPAVVPNPFSGLGVHAPSAPTDVPFLDVKKVRSAVGQELKSQDVVRTPQEAQYSQLYGALTQDMKQGINTIDRTNAGVPTGPLQWGDQPATNAFNRANDYFHTGMDRFGRVSPFVNKAAPEDAYKMYASAAKGNTSTLQAVKKSISPETRGIAAATILDDMGSANPGSQNAQGNVFSPETFLTQYGKLQPGRAEVFSGFPNSEKVSAGVDDMAKAASMLRDSSKVWANPSGTGQNMMAQGALGSILGNIFTNPVVAAGGLAGLMGGNQLSKRIMLNPNIVQKAIAPTDYGPLSQLRQQQDWQRMMMAIENQNVQH